MAHFGVDQPVDSPPVGKAASANPRPDRQVHEILQSLPGAPHAFADCCGIDVGIHCHRQSQALAKRADHIRILPTRFRRGGDVAKFRGLRVQIDRAKTGHPNRRQRFLDI